MTDKLAEAVRRGHEADGLLNHPLLIELFDTYKRDLLAFWEATPARDTDARERIWHAVQAAQKVRDGLKFIAAHGRLAKSEIEQLAGMTGEAE